MLSVAVMTKGGLPVVSAGSTLRMHRSPYTRRGAVAAGHPATAQVGAAILDAGGNAADAAVAMVLASCVTEGTLTSLGGGGFFLVGGAGVDQPVVIDAFVRQPGHGLQRSLAPWERFDLHLAGAVLSFGTGPASVGVPMLPAGVDLVARRFGRLGLARCAAPAATLAQDGYELTGFHAGEQALNLGLLRRDSEGAAIFLDPATGRTRPAGSVFRQPLLAATLEELGRSGGQSFYTGAIGRRLLRWSDERGARITSSDLAAAQVESRAPLSLRLGDGVLLANPAPSYGGDILRQLAARLLHADAPAGSHHVARSVVDVIGAVAAPRTSPPLHGEHVEHRAAQRPVGEERFASSPHTTHIVAVDRDGMFVSVTHTVGYGSGEFIPGTGVQLNNMLAEYDHRLQRPVGSPVPSMMTPAAWIDGKRSLVLGSAGSDRIPQAIAQVLARVTREGRSLLDAITAPRCSFDTMHLHVEPGFGGWHGDIVEALPPMNCWVEPDAYFGTTNAVLVTGSDTEAVGDPRRSGAGITVG